MAVLPEIPKPLPAELIEGPDAIKEAAALEADVDLGRRKALNDFNELGRNDDRNSHLHRITVIGLYFVAACCAVMFLTLVGQYTLPQKYKPLDQDGATKLQGFLFSGAVGAAISAGANSLKRR